jgi:N-acetylglutamate synthase-like GNAT family acetyltransferase
MKDKINTGYDPGDAPQMFVNANTQNSGERDFLIHKTSYDNVVDYYYIMDNDAGSFGMAYLYRDDLESIYLEAISVSSNLRKKGRGTQILLYLENLGRTLNCNYVYLWVLKDSFMERWYKKSGYEYYNEKDEKNIWLRKKIRNRDER